jgi:hypothetical protein
MPWGASEQGLDRQGPAGFRILEPLVPLPDNGMRIKTILRVCCEFITTKAGEGVLKSENSFQQVTGQGCK